MSSPTFEQAVSDLADRSMLLMPMPATWLSGSTPRVAWAVMRMDYREELRYYPMFMVTGGHADWREAYEAAQSPTALIATHYSTPQEIREALRGSAL